MNNYEEIQNILRQQIMKRVALYYEVTHHTNPIFQPGDPIPYGGRVFDEQEMMHLVDSALDFWLTTGKYAQQFESYFSKFLGIKYCSLTNSGSSANLLAFMALTSPHLGERRIQQGDEVITVAATFPTTVAPIMQYGAIPVFVDVTLPTYNIDVSQLEEALSPKTKAIMIAHTLGNPFDLEQVMDFCQQHGLWLIEDNCDALGASYLYHDQWKTTGTFGHIGTSSFYPPHHMTMGEGGAVYTNHSELKRIVDSLRDWGRDCWCASGKDNTCQQRFQQQFGDLPFGYDHKYVYSHFGYNLKVTDMQAAVGCAQLKKLPSFIKQRQDHWQTLWDGLKDLEDIFILPEATTNSKPSWFGFALTLREKAPFTRDEMVAYLEGKGIQTRMLFAGNLLKHPCFTDLKTTKPSYKVIGELPNTDRIMNQTLWLGVYPGLQPVMLEFMIEQIRKYRDIRKGSYHATT